MERRTIGSNIEATIEGDTLTLTIDLAQDLGASRSGKSRLIATTGGNIRLPNGTRLGVNCYREPAIGEQTVTADVETRRPS